MSKPIALATLVLLSLSLAYAQSGFETSPDPNAGLVTLPARQQFLDSSCVVAVLNRTTQVSADGTWILPTVPANFGPVRARATCINNGATQFGQSDLFVVGADQSITVPPIVLGITSPIPTLITVAASTGTLIAQGQTVQLTTTATYQGGTTGDISSSAAGTQYEVSNSAIATVGADGLVTAVSSGNVLIQALNEGAQGIINLQVNLGGASNGGVPNSWIVSNFCPNFSLGTPCPQLTDPSFASEDPDHDGLSNLQEFQNGTDPNNPDSDGDGLTDGQEVLVYHTNPLLFSTDGTGIPDGIEVETGTLGNTFAAKLAAAVSKFAIAPSSFTLAVNSLSDIATQQLTATATLIDGKTKLDLTSTTKGTSYASSDLTVCNFGAPDGDVFAGNVGSCTITVNNGAFTASANGQVTGFTPTPLGFVNIPGFANGVAVNGNYAFVAAGSAGLQVVDVSNRNAPVIAASLALTGNANSVRVVGNIGFIAAGTGGLYAIDLTNPLTPIVLANLNTGGTALDVTVQGSTAYVANSTGIVLVNVADTRLMTKIAALPLAGTIRGIAVDASREIAAMAAGTGGIYLIDISNPAAPAILSQLAVGNAAQVAFRNNYVLVAGHHAISAPYQNSLVSVDTSIPQAPMVVSTIANQALGGNLNDLALSGNFALGAEVFFVNGIPITDITDPTNLRSRAILNFPQRDDNGMGIAVDGTFVYLSTDQSAVEKFGAAGAGRLYIGQYQVLQDTFGIAPAVNILSPASGTTVVQGATIRVSVSATDDVAVAGVNLLVNGQPVLTNTVAPYVFFYTVPTGASTLTLGASAVDFGGNVATATNIVLTAIPDPGTTVVGRVVDESQNPLPAFNVQTLGRSAKTAADGTFSIAGVPSISAINGIVVTTYGVAGGIVRAGASTATVPVSGGITNVGDIVAAKRPWIFISTSSGNALKLDPSQSPAVISVSPTVAGGGPNAITPDGAKGVVVGADVIRTYDLTATPPAYAGDFTGTSVSGSNMIAITSDGRLAVAPPLQSEVASFDLSTNKLINVVKVPFTPALAITPDNTTVVVFDTNDNLFRVFNLSPLGALTDTGKTVPYNFRFWAPRLVFAPSGRVGLIANPDGNFIAIMRVDAQHNVTLDAATIPMCCNPWGIDITPDGTRAYVGVGSTNSLAVLSIDGSDQVTDTGARIPIPNGIGAARTGARQGASGIAIAADGRAYVANTTFNTATQQSTVTIVDTNTNTVLGTVAIPVFAVGIAAPR